MRVRRIRYGAATSQFADLHLPAGRGPHPVCVVVHGGFWRVRYGYDLGTPLAADLAVAGVAALNVEYRRVGPGGSGGGGWPATGEDVLSAVGALAEVGAVDDLDLMRLVTMGHSAGGQLAVWLAGALAQASAGDDSPPVRIRGVISQAGVLDLDAAFAADLGGGAVAGFLGGSPDEVRAAYRQASPMARLPLGVPALLVHAVDDATVPVEQSRSYRDAAVAAGDRCDLVEFPSDDHFEVITVGSAAWAACRAAAVSFVATGAC